MQSSPKRKMPRWLWVILGIAVFCCLAGVVLFILLNTVWAPQCAPPPCLADRNYRLTCPAGAWCVHGCGMVCATKTPGPGCPVIKCGEGQIAACTLADCPNNCGLACVTVMPYEPTFTPNTPMIMCTAPACRAGEVYYCGGECPGGCGTSCATPTPVKK